jgi:hypothetical protein
MGIFSRNSRAWALNAPFCCRIRHVSPGPPRFCVSFAAPRLRWSGIKGIETIRPWTLDALATALSGRRRLTRTPVKTFFYPGVP